MCAVIRIPCTSKTWGRAVLACIWCCIVEHTCWTLRNTSKSLKFVQFRCLITTLTYGWHIWYACRTWIVTRRIKQQAICDLVNKVCSGRACAIVYIHCHHNKAICLVCIIQRIYETCYFYGDTHIISPLIWGKCVWYHNLPCRLLQRDSLNWTWIDRSNICSYVLLNTNLRRIYH